MQVLHKYPLLMSASMQPLLMDPGAVIIHIGWKDEHPNIWVQEDSSAAKETRTFRILGTGDIVDSRDTHRGSVVVGSFVWHIYERR